MIRICRADSATITLYIGRPHPQRKLCFKINIGIGKGFNHYNLGDAQIDTFCADFLQTGQIVCFWSCIDTYISNYNYLLTVRTKDSVVVNDDGEVVELQQNTKKTQKLLMSTVHQVFIPDLLFSTKVPIFAHFISAGSGSPSGFVFLHWWTAINITYDKNDRSSQPMNAGWSFTICMFHLLSFIF